MGHFSLAASGSSLPAPIVGAIVENIIIWVPIIFFGIIIYFLWRMLKLMARTKPQVIEADSDSAAPWGDVAGVEETRAELEEFFADVAPGSDSASSVGHVVPLANDG